jgi:PAS domain S-box-containing protein
LEEFLMAEKPTYEEIDQRVKGLEREAISCMYAEEEAQEAESRFRKLFQTMTEGVALHELVYDENGIPLDYVILDTNPAYERYTGIKAEDTIGKKASELYGTGKPPYFDIYERVATSGQPTAFETYFDPMKKYFFISAFSLGKGKFATVFEDITERKRTEEELRDSEERLRILFEYAPDAYYLNDSKGNFIDGNIAAEKMIGYKKNELIGENFLKLKVLPPQQIPKAAKHLALNVLGRPSGQDEFTLIRKDGSRVQTEIRTYPVKIKGKSMVLGIARDITLRKRTEKALRKAHDDLERRVKERTAELAEANKHLKQQIDERKKTEQALRKSEEKYRNLIEKSDDIIWTTDLDLRTIYVSSSIEKKLGYTPEERMAQDLDVQMTPSSYTHVAEFLLQELKREQEKNANPNRIIRVEVEYYHKNGSILWFENIASGLRDENGTLTGIQGISRDITDRKRAEEALRESEERFRSIFEESAMPIAIAKMNSEILQVNSAFCRLLGYSEPELKELTFRDFTHPEDAEHLMPWYKKCIRGELRSYQIGQRLFTKNGELVHINLTITAMHDKAGKPAYVVAIIDDINDRILAEKALRQSEHRFREMADLLPSIICEMDRNLRLTYVNNFGLEIFCYTQNEFDAGINAMDLIHPDDREKLSKRIEQVFKGITVGPIEYRMLRKDGSKVVVFVNSNPIYEDDQISGIRASMTDITEQKDMLQEILKARKLEAIGILAGGLAHDFNNALTAVMGNISLAQMDCNKGDLIYENLSKAEKAAMVARNLANKLITFSRGGEPLKKKASIPRVLRESTELALSGSNIEYVFSIPDKLHMLEFDENQINQALQNIIINAKEAMPQGGEVQVIAENIFIDEGEVPNLKAGQYVKISIRDQGKGIPEEHLERIFDPYFSTKERGAQKGMGMGLSISYSIIKRHNGQTTVESILEKGTTFAIYLPAVRAEDGVSEVDIEERRDADRVSKKILVMDDEQMVLDVAGQMLNRLGYEIEFAENGKEAIEKYERAKDSGEPFHALILDLTIRGGMGGVEAIEKLLAIDPGVKAFVSSGYSDDPAITGYDAYGFCGALTKPYSFKKLGQALSKI